MLNTSWLKPLLRSRVVQVLVAAATGTITGLIVFDVTRVTGVGLFVITGAVAGVLAALVLQFYRRAVRLTEVKVTIPQFSELTFVVNNDARQVAWKLFIETVTRISTQALHDEGGLIREAFSSLYSLFGTTREILKSSRPSVPVAGSQTIEHLAVTMLNWELRPFLSKWHPRLQRFEQASQTDPLRVWPEEAECRVELRQIQEHLRIYALGFARLAGVQDADAMIARTVPSDDSK